MNKSTEVNPDEIFALKLLREYLADHVVLNFQCMGKANDPPDLIVEWENGERWGVEVTRTYQQVRSIKGSKVVSSETVHLPLENFAECLRNKFADKCERGYVLCLEGLGPFSSWKSPTSFKKWRKEVEEKIRRHIASDSTKTLKFDGGKLQPDKIGGQWVNMIAAPATEISSSMDMMLYRPLQIKTKDLSRWSDEFDQRWLLLLNCNPLVDNVAEVEGVLRKLTQEHQRLNGFNGFFWSGCRDRCLVPISLEKPRSPSNL